MRFAILETGHPPRALQPRFGTYTDMFADLLGKDAVEAVYRVEDGIFPARPEAHGAYLVTGSSAGVYDPLPWIAPLKQFLRDARGKARLVGICFGHQIMAEAFGGRVEKSGKGWGIGIQDYALAADAEWTQGAATISVPVCHQDQVAALPPHARIFGGNPFCPIGCLAYEDQPAISVQFHPEFETEFVRELIVLLEEELDAPQAARVSLAKSNERRNVARWIKSFLA